MKTTFLYGSTLFETLAGNARTHAGVLACLFGVACASTLEDPELSSKPQDLAAPKIAAGTDARSPIVRTEVRRTGEIVEVEVESEHPFHFGAVPPILVIGDQAFGRSHFGADGSLNTLVFVLDARDYDALPAAASVSFGYLRSGAELESPPREARGSARTPKIRPEQVRAPRLPLGTLHRVRMEIAQ